MTTHWKVGGHWFVGTAENPATALEVTIGNANEFTIGFYNFVCLGFYLDATVGPLVEFIAPFPYCVFPGILMEIILPQKQILAAAVVAGATAAAGALGGEAGGAGAGVAAGAAAGGLVAVGAYAAIAAANMYKYSACQMDVVYGNYFFTVYGECFDWQQDCYEHDAVDHFHSAKQKLHNVVGRSTETIQSKAIYAARGLAIQAVGQFSATSGIVTVLGNTGVTIAATTMLFLDAPAVYLVAPQIAVQTPSTAITLQATGASLIAPTLYLNGVQSFITGEFAPCPMDEPPDFAAAVAEAQLALTAALAAYLDAMKAHGHAAPAGAQAPHGHHP